MQHNHKGRTSFMQLLKYSGCELGHHPTEKMIDPLLMPTIHSSSLLLHVFANPHFVLPVCFAYIIPWQQGNKRPRSGHLFSPDMVTTESCSTKCGSSVAAEFWSFTPYTRKSALRAPCLLRRPFARYRVQNQMTLFASLGFDYAYILP